MSLKNNEDKNNKKQNIWGYIIVIVLFLIITGIFIFGSLNNKNEDKDFSYTQLLVSINESAVEKIEMVEGSDVAKIKLVNEDEEKTVLIPSTDSFIDLVQEKVNSGVKIELIQKERNIVATIFRTIISFLPTIILVALFLVMFKMQGLGEKGKVYDSETQKTKIKFDDVAGLDEEKQEMIEIVDFLKNPKKFQEMGAKIPRGVLLCGNPGTGKTLIAKAIAGEANVPFISMSGSEFIEMFAGLGASRVRKLFEKARKISPCIVFIDEIDAIGSRRTSSSGSETENNQTLNQLLVEMDGFDTEETIIVLAATNRPEMLDKALLRPGRFDRQITVGLPDLNGREAILKIHAKDKKFFNDVDLRSIAEDTAGFTGAELANILNEAAIIATIRERESITNKDIEDAVKKVTVGLEKHNRIISDKDKKLTAFHEAGHAIVSKFLDTQKDIKEISIIPRGMAGGYTMYKTNEDKCYISKTEMEEKLIALLGGRAAEKLALNDISTGASNDLEVANDIAKNMVTVYGMSDSVGPIHINLEKDPYQLQLLGDKYADLIGNEIKMLVESAYLKAQAILNNNMDKLELVANELLKNEVLTAERFDELMMM
ncbi:MAG: ATP-dependent zinc metalloprotease FtsH [Clostridiales bacterium]|nr:ATP-dependent zinc metalloprotease FtsH [Clostridiales bacterium]